MRVESEHTPASRTLPEAGGGSLSEDVVVQAERETVATAQALLEVLEGGQQAAMYILQPSAVPIEPVVITDGSWRRWRGRQSG